MLPRVPTEYSEMTALAAWLDLRRVVWCHAANETRGTAAHYQRRQRIGVKAGVPDVLIFSLPRALTPEMCSAVTALRCPVRGVAIELKRAKGGRLTNEQARWLSTLRECGWLAERHDGARAAIAWLEGLGY